ncbi:methylated-DNA--cysteine S-met [Mollisia scopiformis]|uniref:Methylated-DNA--protein-cysteine methyltransferase n=1 Tax=Mollisia scopiformis TaxID=149040 RepID=A0A194WU38_MOLSC|nr:methylated-DNA--cysteine S-met [Mollisia scopiformis]KUJ11470.1 methylated-DNA--cysteine S-met [Mollisia scopiformis]
MAVTEYQERVYALLCQIPRGKVSSYAALSKALSSSPRAVGGALRRNPYAPEVPCHRIICADGSVGGFKGDAQDAPSKINQVEKLRLLKGEGVLFDEKLNLVDGNSWWDGFDTEENQMKKPWK